MALIAFAATITGLALAMSSLDGALVRPLVGALGALMVLAAAIAPQSRRALGALAARHWPGVLAAALAVAVVAGQLGAGAPELTLSIAGPIAAFIGIALAAPAAAAIAYAYGRGRLTIALLLMAIPVAFAAVLTSNLSLDGPLGRLAPSLDAPGLLSGFGLMVILAIHAAADELRRRPSAGEPSLPPLARRLFAPVAGLVTSLAMLLIAGAPEELGAAAAGSLVFAGALWPRARRSRVGGAVAPALAIVSVGVGALALLSAALADGARAADFTNGTDTGVTLWMAQAGAAGAAASALIVAALGAVLVVSKDRGRRPSRGAPLLIGAAAYAALASWYAPGLIAPPAAFFFAVITGLAASYLDADRSK